MPRTPLSGEILLKLSEALPDTGASSLLYFRIFLLQGFKGSERGGWEPGDFHRRCLSVHRTADSIRSLSASIAPIGRPAPRAFARQVISALTSKFSMARKGPVLKQPAWTSSATRRTSLSVQIRLTSLWNSGGGMCDRLLPGSAR